MNRTPVIERAGSYLNLHASRAGTLPHRPPPTMFVTISREAGAGATTLAHLLAKDLNCGRSTRTPKWRVFDGNLVEAMLRDRSYPDRLAKYLPEDNVSEVDAAIGELLGLHPNIWEMIEGVDDLMRKLASEGRCILIGRGANFATRDIPGGLHLRLIGDPDDRAWHMAQKLDIPMEKARSRNEKADRARRRYTLKHFNEEITAASGYDAVFNTTSISLQEICRWLEGVMHARTHAQVAR